MDALVGPPFVISSSVRRVITPRFLDSQSHLSVSTTIRHLPPFVAVISAGIVGGDLRCGMGLSIQQESSIAPFVGQ